jgi:hypothetical protein
MKGNRIFSRLAMIRVFYPNGEPPRPQNVPKEDAAHPTRPAFAPAKLILFKISPISIEKRC